jgi:RNA polymerase sigma factor (sigma-70 family)
MSDQHSVTVHLPKLAGASSLPDDVAAIIVERYFDRLVRLARSQLSGKMRQRVGASDVVQNVLLSLEKMVRKGNALELQDRRDLFALLAKMTRNKALKAVEHHQAGKRAVDREQAATGGTGGGADGGGDGLLASIRDHEPTAEDAMAFAELCEELADELGEPYDAIPAMLVQGRTHREIADALGCTTRTVERKVQRIREHLRQIEREEGSDEAPE